VAYGVVRGSVSQIFVTVGSYSWNAVYSGDSNNDGATSPCESLAVNSAGASISTVLSASLIIYGSSVTDSATLSGTVGSAGGTVTYEFFSGSYCSGSPIVTPTTTNGLIVTVTSGVVPSSPPETFSYSGFYSWNAVYSGDPSTNNNGATSPCEPLNVKGSMIDISLSSTIINVGGSVFATSTLTGITSTAGGTVQYEYFSGSTCAAPAIPTPVGLPVTVTDGVVPNSVSLQFGSPGLYSWNAVYSGDTLNNGATSACELLTVDMTSPTITSSLSSTAITIGQSVTGSATLSGGFQAGGTVTYEYFLGSTCTGIAPISGSVTVTDGAVPSLESQPFNTAGSYSEMAVYSGDPNNNAATSGCEPFTVTPGTSSTTTTLVLPTGVTASSVPLGDAVGDTAAVTFTPSGFTATGTVTFNFYDNGGCTGAVAATFGGIALGSSPPAQTPSAAGSYSWDAQYIAGTNDDYQTSTLSGCEPFTITTTTTTTTTVSSSAVKVGGSVPYAAPNPGASPSYAASSLPSVSAGALVTTGVWHFELQGTEGSSWAATSAPVAVAVSSGDD
jgi:hypothetical protein